jgi:hypothetical protein
MPTPSGWHFGFIHGEIPGSNPARRLALWTGVFRISDVGLLKPTRPMVGYTLEQAMITFLYPFEIITRASIVTFQPTETIRSKRILT